MGKSKSLKKELVLTDPSENLLEAIVSGIHEKKGHSIVVLDIKSAGSSITDFFVVCHGDSATQVKAIAESVEEEVKRRTSEYPVFKEGYANSEWILLDYINVVVHVFLKEQREFYGIERFWADAEIRNIT